MGFTTEILTEFGYTVIPAGNGEEAVAVYRDHWREIGLCLLDVVMPKKQCSEVFEDIRRVNPDLKVLFMSGYQEDAGPRNFLISEGNCFIAKPLRAHELLRKVREALDR